MFASSLGPRESNETSKQQTSFWREWPWRDGLIAAGGVIVVTSTGFFIAPEGLTSVGNTLYQLAKGFVERPEDVPAGYALLVALRYDLGVVLFGLIGLYFALTEDGFFARFLGGWMIFGLIMSLLYQNAGPDAALWIVFPASGLTAMLVARMLRDPSIGYWVVPNWGVAVHALATAALLTSVALNGLGIATALLREAQPFGYHRLNVSGNADTGGEIGTFNENVGENTFELRSEVALSLVIQLKAIDSEISPVLRIEDNSGEIIVPPTPYPGGRQGLVIDDFQLAARETYFIRVAPSEPVSPRGQFVVLTHPAGVSDQNSILPFNTRLDVPEVWTLLRSARNQNLPPLTILITVFLLLLIMIAYFLVGSIWGSRAAWRGLGFGFLLYFSVAGLGLGWQASVTYGDDPRELWQINPATPQHERLIETLEEMSRHGTGLKDAISITVMSPGDGSVAWTLRNFPNVDYVNGVGIETTTQAVLIPYAERDTILGDDYVGQDFVLGEHWGLSDLSWLDALSWLNTRDTRFAPVIDEHYLLLIRHDVYGVSEVISTQSSP